MLLRAVVGNFPDPHAGWVALAMASTLAGNLTITGSIANIIVVERAAGDLLVCDDMALDSGLIEPLIEVALSVNDRIRSAPPAGPVLRPSQSSTGSETRVVRASRRTQSQQLEKWQMSSSAFRAERLSSPW
jgi:hypothetical protein